MNLSLSIHIYIYIYIWPLDIKCLFPYLEKKMAGPGWPGPAWPNRAWTCLWAVLSGSRPAWPRTGAGPARQFCFLRTSCQKTTPSHTFSPFGPPYL